LTAFKPMLQESFYEFLLLLLHEQHLTVFKI
jgi:hypothetical protein